MPAPTTSSSKGPTLSPAELAQLEHAFATDPNSESYRALAEAYLGMGRFMEAMVVCKKGVKAHPDRADPRVLLARVYAEQGKDRKAIEELEGAIAAVPADVTALRMAAGLLLKAGDNDKGKDYALRAYKANKADADTRELLEKWKIEVPVEAPPPAPPPAVLTAPTADELNEAVTGPSDVPSAPGLAEAFEPAVRPATGTPRAQPVRQARPATQRPATPQRPQIDLSRFEESDEPVRQSGNSGMVFLGTLVVAAISLGGFYLYKRHKAEQSAEIAAAAHEAKEALGLDSYASYKKACDAAERVLKLDPDSASAHAYLAYAYAIRWGEHGEGETAKSQALDHLEKAKKLKNGDSAFYVAASALVEFFDKKPDQAEAELSKEVADFESKQQTNSLLYETLGIIEMRNGDLEKAAQHLKKAIDLAPAEPRIHAAIGDLYRRQGQELLAWNYYDNALRYEKDHADAVLGKSLLVLEAIRPDYKMAEDLIKRVRDSEPPPSPRQLAMAYVLDGMRLAQQGKSAEAAIQEQKGIALDRTNPEIYVLVGRRLLHDGKADEGLKQIQEAISLDPKRASFYVELARAQMATPNGAKAAVESLNKALKTLPGSAKLLALQGDALLKSGDAKSAKDSYEKALKIDPKAQLPDAKLALAELDRHAKDYANAQTYYDQAINEFGTNGPKVAEALTDEGQMLEEKGEGREKVLDLYAKAAGVEPNYGPAYYFAAKILSADKKAKDKVKEFAAQYLKVDPKGPYVTEATKLASGK